MTYNVFGGILNLAQLHLQPYIDILAYLGFVGLRLILTGKGWVSTASSIVGLLLVLILDHMLNTSWCL